MLQSKGSLKVRHDWTTSLSLFTFMEKEMATHSSVLAWKIPGTGEPHGLPSMGSHRVRHDWSNLAAAAVAIHERCIMCNFTYMVQFSHSVTSNSVTPWTAALEASLSITDSQSLIKVMFIELVMPSNHLILCLQFFPAPGSFQMSQFFTSAGQSIGVSASASVLPMNIQYWFPLGLTGLISLQSKRHSRVFSNTTVQKHQFFGAQLSL